MTSAARARYHRDPAHRGHSAPVHWTLATSFPVATAAEQRAALTLYGHRWLVELYFRLLKSDGLGLEATRVRRVDHWVALLLLGMDEVLRAEELVSLRSGDARGAHEAFGADEVAVLDADAHARTRPPGRGGRVYASVNGEPPGTVSYYVVQVAILGGYAGGKGSPPGRRVIARGLTRLGDRVRALRQQRRYDEFKKSVT